MNTANNTNLQILATDGTSNIICCEKMRLTQHMLLNLNYTYFGNLSN